MDVKEILEKKNIKYKSRGRDYQVICLNPKNDDHNPSMNIDKISGLFHCLSCGFSGDIYKYFKINKEKYIDEKAAEVMEKIKALINDRELIYPLDANHFRDSYRGIKAETFRKFGAFTSESQDLGMDGRLIFPIFDINGRIVLFQGRYLHSDLEPKYKNYPRDVTLPLYPQVVELLDSSIILVEGFYDMLNLHDKGLTNAVCTFGTSFGTVKRSAKQNKNIDKLLIYKYQGVDKIYIMYDSDDPGRAAADNLQRYLSSTFTTEIIELDEGSDPGSLKDFEVLKLKEKLYA